MSLMESSEVSRRGLDRLTWKWEVLPVLALFNEELLLIAYFHLKTKAIPPFFFSFRVPACFGLP